MLCVNNYHREYINECRAKVEFQVSTYKKVAALKTAGKLSNALDSFEPVFFNNMVLVLDSLFIHRGRAKEMKDGNTLNEVRLLCGSLTQNGDKMMVDKTIK